MPSPFSDVVFWTSVVLCVVAQFGILRSVFAPREAPPPRAGLPVPRRVAEVIWAVVPAVGLAALLLLTWRAIHPRTAPSPAAAVTALAGGSAAVGGGGDR